ncbi:OmpA family protein [uncultured Sphingomonas sp.]|uniref:OmpA family protein n=1 Tax=uncultured Sphingomonas sp. TaxID=158754 RepID=UPI0025F54BCD|nr:OmpA family protein [uncultured Sphingomonas sp.]
MKTNAIIAALGLAALLTLASGCGSRATAGEAVAAAPTEGPGKLILLPDSAIAVHSGSVEEALALYLASDAPAPRRFRFADAEFQPWQARPNPATLRTVYAVQQILRAYPRVKVTVVGHTDTDGDAARNLALSRARAGRVATLLEQGGIARRRITAVGRGMAEPIADNAAPDGRARNRRIELIVTAK